MGHYIRMGGSRRLTYKDSRLGIPSKVFLRKWGNLSLFHHPFDFGSESFQVFLIRSVLIMQDLLRQIGVVPVKPAWGFQKPALIQRNTHKRTHSCHCHLFYSPFSGRRIGFNDLRLPLGDQPLDEASDRTPLLRRQLLTS